METAVEGVRNRGTEKAGKLSTLQQMREDAVVNTGSILIIIIY
jgi:hypothetical protein